MKHVRDDLTALLDGALPPAEREQVEAHLAGCAECRAVAARLRAALAAFAALPPPPGPSPAFEQRFHARLARERLPRAGLLGRLPWRWLVPAGAACAAAAVVVVADVRQQREQELAARHLELFLSYELVVAADELPDEDVELVAHLHELGGKP